MAAIAPKKHVFISYCHENTAAVALLRSDLLAAGESVWWDQDIEPGEDWRFAIKHAIAEAYSIVLCLSKEAQERKIAGIYPEAADAIDAFRQFAPGSIFLIPVRLSECAIPQIEIDGTRFLDRLQYVDLFPPAFRAGALARLIKSIKASPLHP